jgi:hypothetical protein
MKEFIDKLISRLEGKRSEVNGLSDIVWNNAVKMCVDEVNQLAEEYNNDFCEWEIVVDKDIHREYKPLCSENGFIEITGYFDYEYCPYCGKKIRVAPYQPKGE